MSSYTKSMLEKIVTSPYIQKLLKDWMRLYISGDKGADFLFDELCKHPVFGFGDSSESEIPHEGLGISKLGVVDVEKAVKKFMEEGSKKP